MTIDLVPLSQFSARHSKGWRMVPGYDRKAGDFAVTMMSPGHEMVRKSNVERGRLSGEFAMKAGISRGAATKLRKLVKA